MHSKIGDIFPEEFKKRHYDRKLEVGSILLLDADIIGIPKKKFIVLSGFDEKYEKVALVLINSNPNKNIFTEKLIKEAHYKIKQNNYPEILTKDSYIDCTQLHEIGKADIIKFLSDNSERYKGNLIAVDINEMRKRIHFCDLIPLYQKRKFGLDIYP